MAVTVELFGIARERAGVASIEIEVSGEPPRLGDVLAETARRLPGLEGECLDGGGLRPGYVVSVNASRFTRDPGERLADGDSVLLMAADAGG